MGLLRSWLMYLSCHVPSTFYCTFEPNIPLGGAIKTSSELNWDPGQDISSQYLHEPRETMEIYRPHFCWCRPAVKPISVHTSTGPCGGMEMHLEHELSTTRGTNFLSSSRLPLWASVFRVPFIFFYHSNDSILNTVRRLSHSPTFLPHWDPIKLGFVFKAAIETFPALFLII